MKISNETHMILKNYASINNGILIRGGNKLSTISESEGIYSQVDVSESFPQDLPIYDLSEFLSTLGLFNSPVLSFTEDSIVITEENSNTKVTYRLTDSQNITFPDDEYELPSEDFSFTITESQLSKLMKACAVMNLEDIRIEASGSSITLNAVDPKNSLSNNYSIEVGGTFKAPFSQTLKAENVKVINGDYTVTGSEEGMVEFKQASGLSYLIALEED